MTCCVVALALAMQIIEGWRRLKRLFGIEARERPVASRGLGTLLAIGLERLRHPAVRYAIFAALALEAGVAGTWLYGHRVRLGQEIQASVFASTGIALGLCDGDPGSTPLRF